MMPREEKDRIHLAMEKAGGNRKIAAVMLGMTYGQLKDKLHASPELHDRWTVESDTKPVPDDVAALNRPLPPVLLSEPPTTEDVAARITSSLTRDAAALKDDLGTLRVPPQAVEIACEMYKFNRQHFMKSLDMLAGGATRQAVMLNHYMDSGWKRLEEVRKLIAATVVETEDGTITITNPALRELLVNEEKCLMSGQSDLLKVLDEYFKTGFKSGETLALLYQRLKGGVTGANGKPGFSADVESEVKE